MGESGRSNPVEFSTPSPQAFTRRRSGMLTRQTKYDAAVFVAILAALTVALSVGGVSTSATRAAQVRDAGELVASMRQSQGPSGFGAVERERLVVVETEVKHIRAELAQVRESLKFHLDPFSILLLLVVGGEKGWAVIKAFKGGHK